MRCKMSGVLVLNEHACSSVVLIIKTVDLMSNFEQPLSSTACLLNTLKGNCYDNNNNNN